MTGFSYANNHEAIEMENTTPGSAVIREFEAYRVTMLHMRRMPLWARNGALLSTK